MRQHEYSAKAKRLPLASAKRARAQALEPEGPSLKEKLLAIVQGDPFINSVMVAAITIGFFHGWLKFNYPHPLVTFLFDGTLLAALSLAYLRHKRNIPFIPRGSVGAALVGFYVVCIIYALLPFGPPLLMSVAALRGWCFATLMYTLGYNMTRSLAQVKGYFYVLIILGVITAAYGIRQSPTEIERRMQEDEQYAARLKGTYYSTQSGQAQLRVFSTFVSAGVFGSVMAHVIIFAVALLSEERAPKTERILLVLAILPMAYGLLLTGARSALVTLGVGFALAAWYHRKFRTFFLLPLAIYLAMRWAAEYTKGAALERYGTLLQTEQVWHRFLNPAIVALYAFADNPIGGGLGKSGYSVPFFLVGRTGYQDTSPGEGDLSCLVIEMGVVGVAAFLRVLYVACKAGYDALIRLRGTPVASLALASAACVLLAVVAFPIGSPFLSIPTGALTWFFAGTLQKLSHDYQASPPAPAPAQAPPTPSGKRFLYSRPPKLAPGRSPPAPSP
jgi:hypothetical protein